VRRDLGLHQHDVKRHRERAGSQPGDGRRRRQMLPSLPLLDADPGRQVASPGRRAHVGNAGRLAALAAGMSVLSASTTALGEPMDPAFERFVVNRGCRTDLGEYNDSPGNLDLLETQVGNRRWCVPDHVSFKKIVSQYGFAFAPTAMHSARTTGFGGFHLSIEAAYTKIDDGALYWQRGTQGPINPSTNNASP